MRLRTTEQFSLSCFHPDRDRAQPHDGADAEPGRGIRLMRGRRFREGGWGGSVRSRPARQAMQPGLVLYAEPIKDWFDGVVFRSVWTGRTKRLHRPLESSSCSRSRPRSQLAAC